MTNAGRRILWSVAAGLAAAATGIVVRQALESSWKRVRGTDPPRNPGAPGIGWPEAMTWGAVTGIAAGTTRVIARRAAAATWEKLMGERPPGS